MAGLRHSVLVFLLVFLSQCHWSQQACPRPTVSSLVMLDPDQSSYSTWSLVILACPSGYSAPNATTNYAYCYSGSPDYWYPDIFSSFDCTLDPVMTTADTTSDGGTIPGEAFVFVTDLTHDEISVADFSDGRLDALYFSPIPFSDVYDPLDVDFDPTSRMVYWVEGGTGRVQRGKLDGSSQEVILDAEVNYPEGIAMDLRRGKLYWTDSRDVQIGRANLDGSFAEIIVNSSLDNPRGIAVHEEESILFWTDWGYPRSAIERSDLNGDNRLVIVNSSIVYPNGITLNAEGTRIYWCDGASDEIGSSDLWGNNRKVVFSTSGVHMFDLLVANDQILWSDWNYGSLGLIADIHDNSSNWSMMYGSVFIAPMGMRVYQENIMGPVPTNNYTPLPSDEPSRDWTTQSPWQPTTSYHQETTPLYFPTPGYEDCGGYYNTASGNISSPNYPRDYDNFLNCVYLITAEANGVMDLHGNRVINITFETFYTESGYDWLDIYDGSSSAAPAIGRYSGSYSYSGPGNLVSSGSSLYLIFHTDGSVTNQGFFARYTTLETQDTPTSPGATTPYDTWTTQHTTGSCRDCCYCGFMSDCYCDSVCQSAGDCCEDYTFYCTSGNGTTPEPTTIDVMTTSSWATTRLPEETGNTRLVNGSETREGRVEVFYNDTWGTVCDHYWDLPDARVACRSAGFPDAVGAYLGALFGQGTGDILLQHLGCTGDESSLFDCYHSGVGVHHCTHTNDASAVCYPNVRLVNGSKSNEGRVEVYYDGVWGTVCDHSWYSTESRVVCRSLGYPNGNPLTYYNAYFGEGSGPVLLNHVGCNGHESSIFDCYHHGIGNNHCYHYDDVGVGCLPNVRLVNGSTSSEGRVEVYQDGVWGTVCDDGWGFNEARVVCRSLGFSDAIQSYYNAYFGQGTGPIQMSYVHCTGDETSILYCYNGGIGVNYCGHYNDVGVSCRTEDAAPTTMDYATSPITSVRLVDGSAAHEGRVEVLHNGVWGTVCDDYWDIMDAQVVCRSLGYPDALNAYSRAYFGPGSGQIWMDNVRCSGTEASLFDCPQNSMGYHDCSHNEDASVECAVDDTQMMCDSASMTLIMDRTLLEIGDHAHDVHFVDESCVGYDHDSDHVAITTMYNQCGTEQKQTDEYIEYTNTVTYYKPRPENGTNQLITREHYLHMKVTCKLERAQQLDDFFLPKINTYSEDEVGYGEFTLSLDRYVNLYSGVLANDTGLVVLGEALYFGVNLTAVTPLTLLIESCWATPTPDQLDSSRYDMIENGCSLDDTIVFYSMSSTFKGFRVDAFTFIGDFAQVFVHCSILVCDASDYTSRCHQGCLARSRRDLQPSGSRSKPHTISVGPLSTNTPGAQAQQVGVASNTDDQTNTVDPISIAAIASLCTFIALTILMAVMMVRMRVSRTRSIAYKPLPVGDVDE